MEIKKRKASEAFPGRSSGPQISSVPRGSSVPRQRSSLSRGSSLPARSKQSVATALPITAQKDAIVAALQRHDVLLLIGETGSGKSTQLPQYLAEAFLNFRSKSTGHGATPVDSTNASRGSSNAPSDPGGPPTLAPAPSPAPPYGREAPLVGHCIAITQPRRVAAISLAKRVADETGTKLGREVGYSVRFDQKFSSRDTRIKYLTEGMLLREMLEDSKLKQYGVVVVDEVHERGVGVDLVLGVLRGLLRERRRRGGRGLKVVVMSATGEMEGLKRFFEEEGQGGHDGTGGEDVKDGREEEWGGFSDDERDGSLEEKEQGVLQAGHTSLASIYIKGRQYPVTINHVSSPIPDVLSACLDRIISIHTTTALPGDILVFLKGQDQVEQLESLCQSYADTLNKPTPGVHPSKHQKLPALLILPLFAALPSHLQSRIFDPTPSFTRKVILSTNIAETSLTIPGIHHVIDTGFRKHRTFRPALNLESLLTVPISKSSARQRAGRAGRTAPGTCWRLYTQKTFESLKDNDDPEILRADLAGVLLTLKALGVQDVLGFPFLTPPVRKNIEQAMISLLQLGAVSPIDGAITETGTRMAQMPLTPALARVLIESDHRGCLAEMVDLVAALSVENLWLTVNERNEDERTQNILESRRRVLLRREGDHLTLLKAVRTYLGLVQQQSSSGGDKSRKQWCDSLGISRRAMGNVLDVRKQLRNLMHLPPASTSPDDNGSEISEATATKILKCLLVGFINNVARLTGSGSTTKNGGKGGTFVGPHAQYLTFSTNQQIWIHPSSVMFGRKTEALLYTEFVFTQKAYARNVSAVQLGWVEEVLRRTGV